MRRFLTMTDAETALASSWQVMTIREKLSEWCREQQLTSKMKFRVQKPEKRWTLVNHRSSHGQLMKISHDQKHSQFHVRWKNSQFPYGRGEMIPHVPLYLTVPSMWVFWEMTSGPGFAFSVRHWKHIHVCFRPLVSDRHLFVSGLRPLVFGSHLFDVFPEFKFPYSVICGSTVDADLRQFTEALWVTSRRSYVKVDSDPAVSRVSCSCRCATTGAR